MAQNEGSEGIMGTVRSYIPGMSSPSTEAHTTSGSQQGILSYIPGFGGSSAGNEAGKDGTAAHQVATDAGEVTSPNKSATSKASAGDIGTGGHHSEEHHKKTSDSTNNYSSSYQGAGIGSKYSSGRDVSDEAPGQAGKTSNLPKDSASGATGHTGSGHNYSDKTGASPGIGKTLGSDATDSPTTGSQKPAHSDYLAKTNDRGHNQGSQGYSGQAQGAKDDGVRGAPIEGEGVQGYAVSAPVGTGDTNVRDSSGAPSGQVSGAHMQYNPEDRDTRDHTGRGTVERTQGQGDSSFANVKRNIPHGTEHVVTKSSQSHIEHTSTTQL